jgi:hypothetical protein
MKADRYALPVGVLGLAIATYGWRLKSGGFFSGWLAALTLFSAWPLGSMALLLIHSLTGGRWGEVLRPALRVGVCSLPLLLPAVLPLAAGLSPLYAWARPDAAGHLANAFYLNVPFFAARGAVYLAVWFVLGWVVLFGRRIARFAPAGLFLLAVTTTFAAIDATMSLDPHFTSSIYGMIAAAGMALLALSMAVLLTAGRATPDERADLGKLLLALVILWIYLDFMQLLIIWQSDLSTDVPWYLDRSRGVWGGLRIAIVIGHFVLPFFLLLSPRMQRSRVVILSVAALLVAMEILRSWWTVLPALGRSIDWIDLACMAGLGGLAIGLGSWMARRPVFARRASHV